MTGIETAAGDRGARDRARVLEVDQRRHRRLRAASQSATATRRFRSDASAPVARCHLREHRNAGARRSADTVREIGRAVELDQVGAAFVHQPHRGRARAALRARPEDGPKGRSQLTSARLTPRRTALHTMSISSSVTSADSAWPQRLTPTRVADRDDVDAGAIGDLRDLSSPTRRRRRSFGRRASSAARPGT